MRKRKTLAEELISVTRKFRKMFLEQTVSDLGEVPAGPAEGEEVNVSADEIGDEVYGDAVQEIVSAMNDAGIDGFEASGITTFVLKKDGKEITFEVSTIDSEPVVVIYTEDGRVTVSLAPLIGYVQSAEDAVEKLANDADALDEFSMLAGDIAGVEVGAESEVDSGDWYGEEPDEEDEFEVGGEEVGDEDEFEVDDEEADSEDEFEIGDNEQGDEDEGSGEDEEAEGGDEEEEEADDSGGVRESIRKKMRALRLREQTDQYDMSSGRRDITIGMIQDSDQKIGGIPVRTVDVIKGKEQVSGGEGKAVTMYPNLYALFREKEGLSDVEGFVREEVPSSESEK